jgi:hypothetical protein
MKRATLLALLLACGTARASEWVPAAETNDGKDRSYVDVSSIRIAGSIRQAWVKHVYEPPMKGMDPYPNKLASSELVRVAFDCSEETSRLEAITNHYTDGDVGTPAASYPTPWTPVAPDSVGNVLMQFICAWKPK